MPADDTDSPIQDRIEVPVDVLVVTRSCYVGIFDLASSVNQPGFWKREFGKVSRFRPRYWFSPMRRAMRIFDFNQLLIDRMNSRQLACWTLLFDGTFRARCEIGEPGEAILQSTSRFESLGGDDFTALVDCPSGHVVIACLSRAGEPALTPQAVVPSGTYEVHVTRDAESEDRHWFLDSEAEYTPGDGPDWRVRLRQVK
jgi:hypothetical protein